MDNAIATVCLSGALNEKLEAIAAAGFKSVEIFENDLLSYNGTPTDVRRMIEDLGLKTITFQPFRDFEGMPEARRARVFQRAERKFDLMQELGCDLLMICSNVSPESLGGIDRAATDLHEIGDRAAKRGMRVAFEALSWGRHIHDYRDAWEAVRRADHPVVGLVLDSFHILARRTDLGGMRAIPRDRIFLVQMADAPLLQMDYLSWSRHYRNFPGQGDLPINDFMKALLSTGYDGLLSLEIFNDQFRAGSARSVAVDGHRSLIYILDQLQQEDPRGRKLQPLLPARSRCLGTEFIEFAIDEESAIYLEALLAGMGFSKAGAHISKSVSRWNQGDINIVLEQPFRQAVGPGELDIPAVRGVGGSLVYFTDPTSELARVWDIDFAQLGGTSLRAGAGLTAIDHISQSMHYQEMLTWLLFYKSLLDVDKLPEQDVLDPGGLVKSQVLQSADGAIRLILNASQSAQTLSSRFLSEAFGSGVQHIAFASSDISVTAKALASNGVALLPIPENYYEDLEAKTDLSGDEIDRLRASNILYERDGDAEYFQLYTQTFANRFFFEIVERRNGYKGFGASNAQIRLTAQARLSPIAP